MIKMREKIIFMDFLVMIILSLLIILDLDLLEMNIFTFLYFRTTAVLLFYYSIIKSIMGIILFIKNIIQKNFILVSKKILFLFIPSLLFIIFINIFTLLVGFKYQFLINGIIVILSVGCLTLLVYYILNKTLSIKMYIKIILAIIQPITYFVGYYILLAMSIG